MAAVTCKGVMKTALFAGTVLSSSGTRLTARRAVKIQCFAQSAGNLSTLAGGSSETTRADPLFTFNARFGAVVDRAGYFSVRADGTLSFQLTLPYKDPILQELQRRFNVKFRSVAGGLLWRTMDRAAIAAVVAAVNGHVYKERRFRQLAAVCVALGDTPRRGPNWEDPALHVGSFSFNE